MRSPAHSMALCVFGTYRPQVNPNEILELETTDFTDSTD
jgi:hypothetical protein